MGGSSQSAPNAKEGYHWILPQFTLPEPHLRNTFKPSATIIGLKIVEYARIARLEERGRPSIAEDE
jgi:hypothetical protein